VTIVTDVVDATVEPVARTAALPGSGGTTHGSEVAMTREVLVRDGSTPPVPPVSRFRAPDREPAALEDAVTDRLRSLIGHELRTPLTSVKGFARLLARREVPPEEVRHFGALIADAVDRFDRVVEQLTAYTLLGSGRVEATLEAVAVTELVERSVARWRTGGLWVETDAAGSGVVPLDPAVVALGLDELLDNARRFAGPLARVVVAARRVDGDLLLSVADEGPGMAADVVSACFEEFTQGQPPLTRDAGGLGLGLAIVRTVAQLHGGAVLCDTAPGRGTIVTLALPSLERG
jgi:signal transduction histidine kinase